MIDVTNKGYSFLMQMGNEDFLIVTFGYSKYLRMIKKNQ